MTASQTQSITETPNDLTRDIDIADAGGIVDLLCKNDAQIFHGWESYRGLAAPEIRERIVEVIERLEPLIRDAADRIIVISGAGTSGRLATFAARTFNRLIADAGKPPIFRYLIAGGDRALIKAQEGAEDNPHQAVEDLQAVIQDAKQVAYFGITCGLSAPYIGGQLDHTLDRANALNVLLGFNPIDLAHNVPIEGWDKTFLDVARRVEASPQGVVLNPIIGPEPIAGSTRMIGGSATKILLELIFSLAILRTTDRLTPHFLLPELRADMPLPELLDRLIQRYDEARIATYHERDTITQLVQIASEALRAKAHIYYLGRDVYGTLGTIDASECPPTFGADFEDVRGFIDQGWLGLLGPGKDLSHVGPPYRISLEEFTNGKLPYLAECDLVIGLGTPDDLAFLGPLLTRSQQAGAGTGAVVLRTAQPGPSRGKDASAQEARELPSALAKRLDTIVAPDIAPSGFIQGYNVLAEFATKLIINGITTGAHVISGKVYQNRMIDLKISNTKLYHRTIRIISTIMGVSEKVARQGLLRAIYETNDISPGLVRAPISRHVEAGTGKEKVVPKALLIATGKFTYEGASSALRKDPVVRNVIEKTLK